MTSPTTSPTSSSLILPAPTSWAFWAVLGTCQLYFHLSHCCSAGKLFLQIFYMVCLSPIFIQLSALMSLLYQGLALPTPFKIGSFTLYNSLVIYFYSQHLSLHKTVSTWDYVIYFLVYIISIYWNEWQIQEVREHSLVPRREPGIQ